MPQTFITRISQLKQYNKTNKTLSWKDDTESRWNGVYALLKKNDNAIFITGDKLLIGTVTKINRGKSIDCSNIQEIICSNDQFLQLHEVFPELISRVKANFTPFIHPKEVNIPQLIKDANNNNFVSYYILSDMRQLGHDQSEFKVNDRIVLINVNQQLENVKLYSEDGLVNFPYSTDVDISVAGRTLDEILDINKKIKRQSAKSNNVTRILNIQSAINQNGKYKFHTFFSYHDGLFNKLVYGQQNTSANRVNQIRLTNESVYKVSMSMKDINEAAFTYCNDRKLIIVHKNTPAKGLATQTQAEAFAERMKVGDYFYMCRGNRNFEVVGKIIGDIESFEYENWGAEGWLQRPYELVAEAVVDGPYHGQDKWWTPNNNSTCIAIPKHEIDEANENIFIPFFNTEFEYKDATPMDKKSDSKKNTLNQILYGPPGTGKTYNTINKALEILGFEIEGKSREKIRELYDAKVKEGAITFTTFHQSMSYEDFIEGIKPIAPKTEGHPVTYKVQDGIFKRLCTSTTPFRIEDKIGNYEVVSCTSEVLTLKKPQGGHISFALSMLNQLMKFLVEHQIDINEFTGKIKPENIDRDKYPELEPQLINGYNNVLPGILKQLKTPKASDSKKILIIDEINRGNVSQIFGELIALIEEDKRLGEAEALQATLPYSKDNFGVPSNLYIIGTMNTADRSVEALDAALRRRFSFVEMPSKPILIAKEGKLKETEGVLGAISLPDVLTMINKRIEKLIDRDHHIGHSYFMTVSNYDELRTTFQNKVIPLLQEYFFGDYGKIGLVLGNGFFEPLVTASENLFAEFDDYDASSFAEKPLYKIKEISKMNDEDLTKAIDILLKK